jgi:Fic family protein
MDLSQFTSSRAGKVIQQPTGYRAFLPRPLPPDPSLQLDQETIRLLTQAALSLGKLNGLASVISDPDLFVYLYVRKEALLSSQIEGTQCSLEDVLGDHGTKNESSDIEEVSNYVAAMNQGLERLKSLPVSNRLIKEMHRILMSGVRGPNKTPGEFRTSQNWIGNPGATLITAQFVPPPPHEALYAMGELEKYIHTDDGLHPLIRAALVHAQFETIHPFLDGNGRLGRLLITFVLCSWSVMDMPLLYLSYFFKANRTEYYSRLMAIRTKGEWEPWVKFFLIGVHETAQMANQAAVEIHSLHKRDAETIRENGSPQSVSQVFHAFCRYPFATIPELQRLIPASNQNTLNRAVQALIDLGIVKKFGTNQRNRKFSYQQYADILTRDTSTRVG